MPGVSVVTEPLRPTGRHVAREDVVRHRHARSDGFWSAGAPTRLTARCHVGLRYVHSGVCRCRGRRFPASVAGVLRLLSTRTGQCCRPDMRTTTLTLAAGRYFTPACGIASPIYLLVGDYVESPSRPHSGSRRHACRGEPRHDGDRRSGAPGPQGPRGPGVMGTVIRRVYTSIGTTTWTKPEGLHHIEVECQGGGGGAGGASQNIPPGAAVSGGGGGGGYARSVLLAAELPASCAVVVGGGGAGGWSGDGPGSPGAHSTFSGTGVNVAGYGAAGGAASGQGNGWAVVPGGGGGSGVGQLIVIGSDAPVGWVVMMDGGTYSPTGGPHGGASHLGGARQGTMNGNGVVGYAGGGGGGPVIGWAAISHYSGGAGGQGVVIVTEHYG